MKKSNFLVTAEILAHEYGVMFSTDGDEFTWWYEENNKIRTKIPPYHPDQRAVENFRSRLRKAMEAQKPAYFDLQNQSEAEKNKIQAYFDKRLGDIKSEFDAKLEAVKNDMSASTDIALAAGVKVDDFTRAFGSIFGQQLPAPIMTEETPLTARQEPILKTGKPIEEPKKGLDALEQLRAKQWADCVAEIEDLFEDDAFDLRILHFLYKCGPHTPHELKQARLWRSSDSVTYFLEDLAANKLVRFLVAEKKYGITNEGIRLLSEEEEEVVSGKIEEGLSEALASARGEPNHAKSTKVAPPPTGPGLAQAKAPEPSKPTLTVVPREPRVLKPVIDVRNEPWFTALTYVEKAMVRLLEKDMTITELQNAIGHTSSWKSLANLMYAADKTSHQGGCIEYLYGQGKGVYHLSDKGRAYIQRIAPNHTKAAS